MADNNVTTRDLLKPIVTLLRLTGCDLKQRSSLISQLFFYCFILTNIFWTVFVIMKLIFGQDNLAVAANTYINYVMASQITYKSYALHAHANELSALMDVFLDKFWDSHSIKELEDKYNKWFKIILWTIKIFRGFVFVCFIVWFAYSLFLPVRKFTLEVWFFGLEPELHKSPTFEIVYAVQFFTALPAAFCLTSIDMVFIVMVSCANMQFDMLKHKFTMIVDGEKMEEEPDEERENEAYEKLQAAVVHHNLCLTFLSDLQNYFNGPLLKQYLDAVTSMGILIYLGQQDFHVFFLIVLITNILQTLLYSFCGQIIQDQSGAIADAAYESGWENIRSLKLRRGLALVIQRANRKFIVTANGFIDISFGNLVAMMQAAFSFLAVLRSTNTTE